MKKILSLLVLLVTTFSAFALDFTDYRKVTLGSNTPTESNNEKLSITDNGDGTYNVTFNDIINKDDSYTDKYGTFTFSNVSGSQTGDFTTVTGTNLTGTVTGGDYGLKSFTDGKLLVKFKDGKAYATMTAKCKVFYSTYTFDVVFGTDEGFGGGGSTGGGEDKPAAFEKVNFVGDGTNFNWSIPVNWETQKIVMSISTATCTTGCEHIIGLGTDGTSRAGNLHVYRTSSDKQLQCYFGAGAVNTGKFDEGNPIKVEISKANGFIVDGTTRITASQLSDLFAMSTVVMGTGEGYNILSHATYNYVKVVDKDWTEVPPVTVKDTKKFENVAYTTSIGGSGTATVTFTEMSDDTFPMTFVSDDLNVKAENLTKGTDEKGRTTYTGTAKRTDVDVTFTVKAVVYTEGTEEKLYMTMDNGSSLVVTVGEDPDAPKVVATVPFTGVTLSASNGVTGTADVTFKEMSDNTVQMTFNGAGYGISATNLTKGTDTKGRTTYTGEAVNDAASTVTYTVNAVVYSEDATQKLYMTMVSVDGTTFTVGENPDPVAPETPKDVTVVEKYQADGTGFSHTINVDWDKQKIVASIDFSNGGDDKDILAMTTGDSFTAFQTSTYRTMHWYCNQTDKQVSGFFAKSGAGNNNTGRIDVTDYLAKFEISKAEGLKVNGEVKMSPAVLDELFASNTVLIGSGESPKFSKAFYNYIKVVSLDWTETTTPDTPEAVVYKNELTIVRGADHKVYNDAEVSVLAKGEGKYEVTLPEFADMDLTNSGTVGKIVFTANGEEVDGVLKLTAENAAGVISTGEGWTNYAADVTMSGEVANNQLAAKFTVVLAGMSDYTYTLGYGKEIFIPTTETVTDWANIKFGDSDPVNIENAKLDITMVSMSTAMVTFKDVMINGNNIGDFAISGVKASINTDDYTTTVLTTEATKGTWVRATENNALGVIVGAESDIRNFEGTQDENAGKTVVKFGVFFGSAYGWADIVFGEKVDTPEPPVTEDYAINFDKDAKQTHTSRYSTSVSLQQTGKDKQTIEFGKTMNGYEDLTAKKFTVEAGSEVTPSIGYVGEWMHGYVYIDLDNNKQFSFNADGADQTGTEVVSYSYYKDQNSKGEAASNNCNVNPMPSFTAPTTPGTYRIRFKVDRDNIDAGGSVASGNNILNNGGGIYDATLEVVEPVTDGISTINAEVANGEAQLFTVDGVQIAKLQKGLNIVRTADGKVKKVLVK